MTYGDAIGNDCLAIRDCLKESGYGGDIYAAEIDHRLQKHGISGIRDIRDYHGDADIIICHVAIYWDYMHSLRTSPERKIFVYHNITPARFFEEYENQMVVEVCTKGREQLRAMRFTPSLCLADSQYNKHDLEKTGYLCPVHVLPIICQFDPPPVTQNRNEGYVNILFVGRLTPNKKQQDIIEAFAIYHRDINPKSRLVLLGGGDDDYVKALKAYPARIGLNGVTFTGHVTDEEKNAYYKQADIFLCLSEHEGFCVPLLEAMHYGIPIIAYGSSAVTETLGRAGLLLESKTPGIVAEAIDLLMTKTSLREQLIANGRERLADFAHGKIQDRLLNEIKSYVAWWQQDRTLYFDVTVQRNFDAGTGIQRVEKEELKFLYGADCGLKTVPFYFDPEGKGLFECETGKLIDPKAGDIIYSADLSIDVTPRNKAWLDGFFAKGIKVWFMLYDFIPIRWPQTCDDNLVPTFNEWLKTVFCYTGVVGISKATIDDAKVYLAEHPAIERNPSLRMEWDWIGCNFGGQTKSKKGMNEGQLQNATGTKDDRSIRLLMVSTVEPRKMYDQAVKAFDLLRERGVNVRLDIVGREGWKAAETVRLIETSPSYGANLFWHKGGISDAELCQLYGKADAVIFASKAEGFGLAITEGAYYGKPLILRDIPVFREIAGNSAFYFSGYEPKDLANAVENWIDLYRAGKAPSSEGIHLTSWQEHGKKLIEILTGEKAS